MSDKRDVLAAALQLSVSDRLELAEKLWESAGPPDLRTDEEWETEVERRVEEVRSGKAKLIPWDEVRRSFGGE